MRTRATIAIGLVLAMLTPLFAGVFAPLVGASSHREAPLIANDPAADSTDFYMFRSPDKQDTVTFIANYIPLQPRYGGPNFHHPGDEVLYEIKIDNDGNATPDVVYQFRFRSERRASALGGPAGDTYLYNDGSITSLNDPNLLFRQFYTLTRQNLDDKNEKSNKVVRSQIIARGQVMPAFVGRASYCPDGTGLGCTEAQAKTNYEGIVAGQAVIATDEGGKVYVGPRQESFYVDLSGVFDLAQFDKTNDTTEFNVTSLAIQVPIAKLLNSANNDPVIGAWTKASRQQTQVIGPNNSRQYRGPFVQVSRLANPLVNEVVIGARDKDRFNASAPKDDVANFAGYVLNPRLAKILNFLFNVGAQETGRGDLVQVFITGIPDGLGLPVTRSKTLTRGGEMMRLNTSTPVTAAPKDLSVLAGDPQGFPNGRRVTDDVVDIELNVVNFRNCSGVDPVLSALDQALRGLPCQAGAMLSDGVDKSGLNFLPSFPYLPTPHSGTEPD